MVTGTSDVIAPKSIIIPKRVNHTISGACIGDLTISGQTLIFYDGAGKWIVLSGATVLSLP